MSQQSINQRIKFLLEKYQLSVRAFSERIDQKAANTQNYVGARGSMPGADYLQSITEHFEEVNPIWLLTGKGEPFIGDAPVPPVSIANKKNKGPVQNNTGNNTITNNINLDNCKKDLATAHKEIVLLTNQLADKERTIQILLKQASS